MPLDLSACELGQAYRQRELSPVEVTTAGIASAMCWEPHINAFITLTSERALADARAAEQRFRKGRPRSAWDGVPIALKDLVETAAIRTTAGSNVLAEYLPTADAAVAARLRQAGCVLIGKTNLPEFAYSDPHPAFGPTRNPWDPTRTAGVSSGGSAAAVATRTVVAAIGTDSGGSIRAPAAYCGVVGFKPSRGLVSNRGVIPCGPSYDHTGPLTRVVSDAAAMLDLIAGYDPQDPASRRRPRTGFAESVERAHDLSGVVFGLLAGFGPDACQPEVRRSVEQALRDLERAGGEIVVLSLPSAGDTFQALWDLCAAEVTQWCRLRFGLDHPGYGPSFRHELSDAASLSAIDYLDRLAVCRQWCAELEVVWKRVDALVVPTRPTLPPIIGVPPTDPIGKRAGSFTAMFNLSGNPVVSVPCGFGAQALPIGIQFVGRVGRDAQVLAVGASYERLNDWSRRQPAIPVIEAGCDDVLLERLTGGESVDCLRS